MLKLLSDSVRFFPFLLSYLWSRQPRAIDIELTNRCNLSCQMCWYHGEKGIGDRYAGSELTSDEVIKLLTQLAIYGPRIYLGGSEPFIRKDILLILKQIKDLNLSVLFTTNGTLLDQEKIKTIVDLGVDHIIFSIDGGEELHDRIRGRGVFGAMTANIKELGNARKEKKCAKPIISVNITITPFIMGHLEETINSIREATQDKVDTYRIHQLWYITPEELSLHRSVTRKVLNCSAPGAACHLNPLAKDINPSALSKEILRLERMPQIKLFPNLDSPGLLHYYSEGPRVRYRCFSPFYRAVIKPNGDVKFCPDEWIDDYVLGNIRDDLFANIWNGQKARYFRSVILRRKSFPACKRCSWMYSFRQ